MGRPGLELGAMGKVCCTQDSSGRWQAAASYRGEGGYVKRIKRTADTKEVAIERLHAACAQAGATSWMKLPPPPPVTAEQISGPRVPKADTPTTLYRFFDSQGQLLYVGISTDPRKRISDHRTNKPWWLQSVRIEMEHYDSWDAARTAEKAAIKTEAPVYNVAEVPSEAELAVSRARERYRTDPDFRRAISEGTVILRS